jgi:hypothetical protein
MAANRWSWLLALVSWQLTCSTPLLGYTKQSPEVVQLINSGLRLIEKTTDERLGGKCLLALVHLKNNTPGHARVSEALVACKALQGEAAGQDVYSNGLAVIFLCEPQSGANPALLNAYVQALMKRQKPHGGWGYDARENGDTSQTQYAALALWALHEHGYTVDASAVQRLTDWLVRTQAPDGGWGYQGELSETSKPVEQYDVTCTMVSAAMGSLMICADLFGLLRPGEASSALVNTPDALRIAGTTEVKNLRRTLPAGPVDRPRLFEALRLGDYWMKRNYRIEAANYGNYYLYALERYRSFQEVLDGVSPEEPTWYNEGVELLRKKRNPDSGGWQSGCGESVDTAFTILFLLRTTQKMLIVSLADGTLVSGRGLPRNLATATMRNGKIVADPARLAIGELMGLIDDEASERISELADDPRALMSGEVTPQDALRFTQLARASNADVRLVALRALSRTGNLDHAPVLIYALTDPDRRVVLAARDGLVFLSCRFPGFGPEDEFTDAERYDAIERWSQWLRSVRPDVAIPLK